MVLIMRRILNDRGNIRFEYNIQHNCDGGKPFVSLSVNGNGDCLI